MINKFKYIAVLALIYSTSFAQAPFKNLDSAQLTTLPILAPTPLRYDILYIGGYDGVTNPKGEVSVGKIDNDFTGYVPINNRSDSGYVIINHESIVKNNAQGDGGGMTVFTAYRNPETKRWEVVDMPKGKFRSVDFSNVGGTFANCGGFQTSWGTVLTAEEWMYEKNEEIYDKGNGITDTSDYLVKKANGVEVNQSLKRYEALDWMVEVDPANATAIQKVYGMGRYGHEGGIMINDSTFFLTDDYSPGYIYLFKTTKPKDLNKGQLFVYQQSNDGLSGKWLPLPMDLTSLVNAHDVSAKKGATMFNRTEWAVYFKGKVYFTETGKDKTDFNEDKIKGADLSIHLKNLDKQDGVLDYKLNDYYGRILCVDMTTNKLTTFLEGGKSPNKKIDLANPDCLAMTTLNGKTYLVIHEDLNGYSFNRVPTGVNTRINEIFWLDMDKTNPTLDDLNRFFIGPDGCETTGGRVTPDGMTYFFNIQHPNPNNPFPYNHPITIAVTGFDEYFKPVQNLEVAIDEASTLVLPTGFIEMKLSKNRFLQLQGNSNAIIFDINGKKIKDYANTNKIDVLNLLKGRYYILVNNSQIYTFVK